MTQIFSHDQVATLVDLVDLWSTDRFVLIGATALACHIDMAWRATDDLDLNLLSTADDYPAGLDSRSGWSRASRSPHRWPSPHNVNIDVLPLSLQPLSAEQLRRLGVGPEFNRAGISLAAAEAIEYPVSETVRIRVALLPVLVILKIVAFMDRPLVRQKDLQDLCHIHGPAPTRHDPSQARDRPRGRLGLRPRGWVGVGRGGRASSRSRVTSRRSRLARAGPGSGSSDRRPPRSADAEHLGSGYS